MLATTIAKKEMVYATLTVIISNMARMALSTPLPLTRRVKTEYLFASITELEPLSLYWRTANLTKKGFHF